MNYLIIFSPIPEFITKMKIFINVTQKGNHSKYIFL